MSPCVEMSRVGTSLGPNWEVEQTGLNDGVGEISEAAPGSVEMRRPCRGLALAEANGLSLSATQP